MELIDKKEFMTITLDNNAKIFLIYIATLLATLAMQIYFFY